MFKEFTLRLRYSGKYLIISVFLLREISFEMRSMIDHRVMQGQCHIFCQEFTSNEVWAGALSWWNDRAICAEHRRDVANLAQVFSALERVECFRHEIFFRSFLVRKKILETVIFKINLAHAHVLHPLPRLTIFSELLYAVRRANCDTATKKAYFQLLQERRIKLLCHSVRKWVVILKSHLLFLPRKLDNSAGHRNIFSKTVSSRDVIQQK